MLRLLPAVFTSGQVDMNHDMYEIGFAAFYIQSFDGIFRLFILTKK